MPSPLPVAKRLFGALLCLVVFDIEGQSLPKLTPGLTVTSDYIFRGVSLTDGEPALQPWVNLHWPNGFYLEFWTSNVDQGNRAVAEVDLKAGWEHRIRASPWTVNLSLTRFMLIGERDLDYNEVGLILERGPLTIGIHYTSDLCGDGLDATYGELSYQIPLAETWALGFHIGRTHAENQEQLINDYQLSLSRRFDYMTAELSVVETSFWSERRGVLKWSFHF